MAVRGAYRSKGVTYSALLHLLIFVLVFFGLPSFLQSRPPEEPMAITVELLPITEVTNVKPAEQPPAPQEKPLDKPEPPKPSPPVKTAEAPPPPPPPPAEKPVPLPKPEEKKPEPKKEEPKKDEKKTKPKDEDLAAVLKAVRETAQKNKEEKTEKTEKDAGSQNKSYSTQYDPTKALSISERDAIRSQIAKCWNVPAGAKDAHELIVVLVLDLEQDGTVIKVALADESKARYSRDSFFRAAADSAMRAVRQCSPLKNLPPEKFQTWRSMELTFDPKEMLF